MNKNKTNKKKQKKNDALKWFMSTSLQTDSNLSNFFHNIIESRIVFHPANVGNSRMYTMQ